MRFVHSELLITILLVFLFSINLQGQSRTDEKHTFNFQGDPLSSVLETVSRETGTDIIYDPEIVEDISIYRFIRNRDISSVLKLILQDTHLDYVTLSTGTIVITTSVREDPLYGSFAGKVVDSHTGKPLAGATVMLADASGGTSTTPSGTFVLNKLISGRHEIVFSFLGYEPTSKIIHIIPNRNIREEITLDPKSIDFKPIIITSHNVRFPDNSGDAQKINPGTPLEPIGNINDAIRSLNLFSGIQFGLPYADLHLQGGREGEHRIYLDGVPVYNPKSFGKMFNAFSPYAIGEVEVQKAGFGPSAGSFTSGRVGLKNDIGSIRQNSLSVQSDPLSVNIRGDLLVPVGNDSSIKVMTAMRTNIWDLYKEPTVKSALQEWDNLDPLITDFLLPSGENVTDYEHANRTSDIKFYDIHMAAEYEFNPYKKLSGSFYIGENSVTTNLLNQLKGEENAELPEFLFGSDTYGWNNYLGQISWDQLVSPRLELRSGVSFSANRLQHEYFLGTSDQPFFGSSNSEAEAVSVLFQTAQSEGLLPNQESSNRIQHFTVRTDLTYSVNPRLNIEGGIQLDLLDSEVKMGELFYLPVDLNQQSNLYSGYLDTKINPGRYLTFSAGSRFTYHSTSDMLYPEPRVSVQFDRPESGIGYWSVRLAGGLYRQFINQFDLTNPGPTSIVPSFTVFSHATTSEIPKSWHLTGSLLLKPYRNTTIKFEAYSKWSPVSYIVSYNNLAITSIQDRSTFEAFGETTSMNSYGAGINLNQALLNSTLKVIAGYDYNSVRIDYDTQFGRTLRAPWNEPHRLQIRIVGDLSSQFTTLLKWQGIWGRAWGFRQAYYDFLFQNQVEIPGFSFSNPENDRLDRFSQLDFSIIYQPDIRIFDLEIRLDLINLLGRRNTIDWNLVPDGDGSDQFKIGKRTMPGFNPTFSLEVKI